MKKTDRILELLTKGDSVESIAKQLDLSKWGTYLILKAYLEENPDVVYCDDSFVFKEINPKNETQVLKMNLTKVLCKDKYVASNFITDKRFKPTNNMGVSTYLKDAITKVGLPCSIEDLLKELHIAAKLKKEFIKMLKTLYPQKIVFFKDHIISMKKIKVIPLIESAALFADTMEDLYTTLKKESQTKKILEAENIKSIDDLQDKLKKRTLDDAIFTRTCNGLYEIKPKINLDTKAKDKIIKQSKEIAQGFFCGFHIELLLEKLKERIPLEIDLKEFKTILVDSGAFKHYKASMILQSECDEVLSNPMAIYSLLSEKPITVEELIEKAKQKGRIFNVIKINNAISGIKTNKLPLTIEKKSIEDISFKKKTGSSRMKKITLYSIPSVKA